jgi:hypothetical protein
METKNPTTACRGRASEIVAIAKPLDIEKPTETPLKTQSEMLAARAVSRRFGVSFAHALVVCSLSGLGGTAA